MEEKKSLLDIFAAVILLVAVVGLITFGVGTWLIRKSQIPVMQKITVEVKVVDSIPGTSYDAEALDSIVKIINNKEKLVESNYEAIVQRQEDERDLKTIFGIFFSILISIAGFFGYKSIREMKEHVKTLAVDEAKVIARDKANSVAYDAAESVAHRVAPLAAKEKAEEVAKITATDTTEHYLNKNLKGLVNDYCDELFKSDVMTDFKNTIVEEVAKAKKSRRSTTKDSVPTPEDFKKSESSDVPTEF